jgi:transposase
MIDEKSMTVKAPPCIRTLRLKVKAEAYPWLNAAAVEVNQVWNWSNETSYKAARPFAGPGKWLTGFDLNNLSAGASECFEHIGSALQLKRNGKSLRFSGKAIRVFEQDRLDGVRWKSGCFAQDAVGDWWLCLPVERAITPSVAKNDEVGLDLGLKDTVATSDGGPHGTDGSGHVCCKVLDVQRVW